MRRWVIGSLLILFTFFFLVASEAQERSFGSAELYDAAMELYYKGRYPESIETFLRLIRLYPASQSVPYAQFMIGQCYFSMGRFEDAIHRFELYLKLYPNGIRAIDAEKGIQLSKEKLSAPPVLPVENRGQRKPVKRRICSQIFYTEAKSLEEVEKQMKALKKAGVDTLIVKAFHDKADRTFPFVTPRQKEGVYFNTKYAPVVEDLLGRLAEIAHRNELDLFAWMTTRYMDYGSDGRPDRRCMSYHFETKKIETARGVTLFHAEVLQNLEGLYQDLGRVPIDGILFQDDLMLRHNEDFSPEASLAFAKEFGFPLQPDLLYIDPYRAESGRVSVKGYTELFWSWADWKNRTLMNVAERLMAAARRSNPNLQFGINLYYETVLNGRNAKARFSQSLSEALEKNFDYYAIMAYHRQTMRALNMDETKAIALMADVAKKAIASVGESSRVMMKIQIVDWRNYEIVPPKEVDDLLTGLLRAGKISLAFVPYSTLFPLSLFKEKWSGKE